MSFSIVPSNLGDTVKETDKDINNTKSSILPMQMTPNKKYVDEKTETIHFLSKYVGRSLFVETFIKKQHAGITQTTTQTVMYIIKTNLCHFFRSIRIEQPCNTKQTNSRRPRISSSKKNSGRHFFSFTEDRVFDLPFKFSFSLPHGLSVSAHVVLNQNR